METGSSSWVPSRHHAAIGTPHTIEHGHTINLAKHSSNCLWQSCHQKKEQRIPEAGLGLANTSNSVRAAARGPTDHINIRILQLMVSGIPVVLGFRLGM